MPEEEFNEISGYRRRKLNIAETVQASARHFKCKQFVKETIPVLEWLPKYSIRNNLMGDIIAGITVAVMHIPQGKFRFV